MTRSTVDGMKIYLCFILDSSQFPTYNTSPTPYTYFIGTFTAWYSLTILDPYFTWTLFTHEKGRIIVITFHHASNQKTSPHNDFISLSFRWTQKNHITLPPLYMHIENNTYAIL